MTEVPLRLAGLDRALVFGCWLAYVLVGAQTTIVTDTARSIPVVYTGLLPDLFKEGKGVVTQGKLGPDGVFRASEVLAKHDENYMPPEAAHALSKAEAEKAAKSVVTGTGATR